MSFPTGGVLCVHQGDADVPIPTSLDISTVAPALIQRVGALEAAQTTAGATLRAAETAAHYALIAAIVSLVGALIAAIVARRNGFVQARTTQQLKHAEFRQAWINQLREEMALFQLRAAQNDETHSKKAEITQSMAAISMRMDREDQDYDRLVGLMKSIILRSGFIPTDTDGIHSDARDNADFIMICQDILKREWEVTKDEMHATPWGWPWNWFVARRRKRDRLARVAANQERRRLQNDKIQGQAETAEQLPPPA